MGQIQNSFVEAVERFIPSKMTKTKYSVPWIDLTIKQLAKKRNKRYLRARKSNDPDVKIHYKRFRSHVQKVLRDAYWKYFSNIFPFENDSSDPDTPKPEKIKKSFGHLSNFLKKTCLGSNHSEKPEFLRQEQANKCNRQFQSAFKREGDSDPPSKGASRLSPKYKLGHITHVHCTTNICKPLYLFKEPLTWILKRLTLSQEMPSCLRARSTHSAGFIFICTSKNCGSFVARA